MEFLQYQIPSILFGLMATVAIIKEARFGPLIGALTIISVIVTSITYGNVAN